MERHLETEQVKPRQAPAITKIGIVIYWCASLVSLFYVVGDTLVNSALRSAIFSFAIPTDFIHRMEIGILTAGFVFTVFQLFLSFKLSRRKNWARMVVVVISSLLLAAYAYQFYISLHAQVPFLAVLKGTYWLAAEVVAASLLLLPASRGWFALGRATAAA